MFILRVAIVRRPRADERHFPCKGIIVVMHGNLSIRMID
jgi:hypothetical protein